jgi:hypothetical protein
MKRLAGSLIAVALCVQAVCAQDQASGSQSGGSSSGSNTSGTHARQDSQQSENKKGQSRNQRNKGKRSIDDVAASVAFSDAVAQSLMEKLADGLEGYSDRFMLSAFDDNKMEGLVNFQQHVVGLFRRCDSFRVHFRIMQTSTEGSKGIAVVDFEMEETPRSADERPVRKRDQLRFEMERGDKGWKIVDVQPRSFFS